MLVFLVAIGSLVPLTPPMVQPAAVAVARPAVDCRWTGSLVQQPEPNGNLFPTTTTIAGEVYSGSLSDLLDTVPAETCNKGGKDCVSDAERVSQLKQRQAQEDEYARKKYEAVLATEAITVPRAAAREAADAAAEVARAERLAAAVAAREAKAAGMPPPETSNKPLPQVAPEKAACFWCG